MTTSHQPAAETLRQQTEATVRQFLTAMETKNMDQLSDVLAEEVVHEMPYAPDGMPKKVSGKANMLQLFANWPTITANADITSALVFYPMQDPDMVFAEFKGEIDIIPTGRHYSQQYGGLFKVQDGKMVLFKEYFNPIRLMYAFGLDAPK